MVYTKWSDRLERTSRWLKFSLFKLFIRLKFPTVRLLTTKEFARWLEQPAPHPFLLDARTQAEYNVSHLKAAVRIDPIAPDLAALLTTPKDTPIIIYCSVGYRSAKIAQQLEQIGFKRVFNLNGGLFQWANEGRPLFRDGHLTQMVHPYNAKWGKLLFVSYHEREHLNSTL